MENRPYQGHVFARNDSRDAIQGNNFAVYKLEFLDANMQFVEGLGQPAGTPLLGYNVFESNPINAGSPRDEWIELGVGGDAPPGTEFVQAVIVHVQLGDGQGNFVGGATFFDDAFVMKVPEPSTLGLAVFALAGLVARARYRKAHPRE
jgi:hypothetical protein